MFPLQPSRDEPVFGTPIIYQGDKILDDLILDHTLVESNIINFSTNINYNKGQKQYGLGERQTGTSDDRSTRRVMHRDIERNRRQEMSKLHTSLRSLLPLEHLQGKRSMGDHMLEAVNYIKNMQNNIQELKIHRDKLRKLSNLSATEDVISSNSCDNLPNSVTVNLVRNGVEILISIKNSEFGLSRVLTELLERGLNAISCVSSKIKGRLIHKIQVEATDTTNIDLLVLQERLAKVIN